MKKNACNLFQNIRDGKFKYYEVRYGVAVYAFRSRTTEFDAN